MDFGNCIILIKDKTVGVSKLQGFDGENNPMLIFTHLIFMVILLLR